MLEVQSIVELNSYEAIHSLSRPLTIEYMDDYMDGAVVKSRKSHRSWNEDRERDKSTFYQQSVDHTKAM